MIDGDYYGERKSMSKEQINMWDAAQLFAQGKGFGDVLDIAQGTKDSLYSVAVVDYESKRYEKAVRGLKLLVLTDPKNADYWSLMGNALKDLGMYQEALSAWYMAMSADPKLKTALVIARVAIAIKNKLWASEGLVMALAHLGNNPKDKEDYQKLIDAYEKL